MTRVVICEKPNQGKTVAKALGGGVTHSSHVVGDGWIVTWGFGHLMRAKWPHEYPDFAARFPPGKETSWTEDSLPFLPKRFEYVVNDPGYIQRQFKLIASFLKKASDVVIATDPDREGELIGWEILKAVGWTGKTYRLWMNDTTVKSVQDDYKKLIPASQTYNLYLAAKARTEADFIHGVNSTRACTLKFSKGEGVISVGRVQTPIVYIIVKHWLSRQSFVKQKYFNFRAEFSKDGQEWSMLYSPKESHRVLDLEKAKEMANSFANSTGVLSVENENVSQNPPNLYNLNDLQKDCNALFEWSAHYTLSVLQILYDIMHWVSYPRSDSNTLPYDHTQRAPEILSNLQETLGLKDKMDVAVKNPLYRDSVYDKKHDSAHYAIIPTLEKPDFSQLKPQKIDGYDNISIQDQESLYRLISYRFIASHMPSAEYFKRSFKIDLNDCPFSATSSVLISEGWRAIPKSPRKIIEDDDSDKSKGSQKPLPDLESGLTMKPQSCVYIEDWTKPPKKLTESDLLARMANIRNYPEFFENPEVRKQLKDDEGLGTSATRGNIIKRALSVGYFSVVSRELVPTQKGLDLIEVLSKVVPRYFDPGLTALWEMQLEKISKGEMDITKFIEGVFDEVRSGTGQILSSSGYSVSSAKSQQGAKSSKSSSNSQYARKSSPPSSSSGTKLKVPFEKKDEAKSLGARWDMKNKFWFAPQGADLSVFKKAGFID